MLLGMVCIIVTPTFQTILVAYISQPKAKQKKQSNTLEWEEDF